MLPLDNLPASYNPGGLSGEEITNLINHTSEPTLLDFSAQLLDKKTLAPVPIPGDPGLEVGDISQFCVGATVEMNTQRDTHRQGTIDLIELPGQTFDPLYHRLRIFCDYYDREYDEANATRLLHWPIATFMGILNQRDITDNGAPLWHINAYDETYRLFKIMFSNDYVAKAGRSYTAVAEELLLLSNMTGLTPDGCPVVGPGLDPSRVHILHDSDLIPEDIVWKAGKDIIGNAVNQLFAAKPNVYYPIYEDEIGGYYGLPMPYYSQALPAPGWIYDTRGPNIVIPPVKQTFSDWSTVYNYVKVLVEPSRGTPFWAEAENNALDSAVSIPNLGERIPLIVKDDACPDIQSAGLKASVLLQLGAALNDTLAFSTICNPSEQPHDTQDITLLGKGAGYYTGTGRDISASHLPGQQLVGSAGYGFEAIAFSINCLTREMTHTVGKRVLL